ncbi:DNA polymerase III subunit delta' [Bowmanella sp. Y26]|uniref:DNA polymerase III subunit delta' n=1 Tax=Bowmanella yangjiangensis TaxID=2811230 RepID=UPI001BDD5432|nr:DNA polymerase III subunit delta' [Bowmanella yangjiangensis]MBT1065025.1 DNA polymerase III subunit delta' [Bowmanella yangjiangensis]
MTYPWFESLFQQLAGRYRAGRLHHALLMLGPQGLGKATLAKDVGAYLLCQRTESSRCGQCQACQLVDAGNHPDLHQIQSEKQIGVDDIRSAIEKLSGKSQLGGAKVLVIHQADSMTESAANALLKTLEEPTAHTYMLLTANSAERLLPTIKSRCEKLLLPGASQAQTSQWLAEQYQGDIEPQLLTLYGATPLTLLAVLQEEAGQRFADFSQDLQQVLNGQLPVLTMAEQWQDNPGRLLSWLQLWLKNAMQQGQYAQDGLFAMYSQCITASRQVTNPGLNKLLLLSSVLGSVRSLRS